VERRYIAVEGPIGVGKTSLARRLADAFECMLIEELADTNPFLGRFYDDPPRWSLQTQLAFLLTRYRQQRSLAATPRDRGAVADYLFAKDRIFAEMNLAGDELVLYREVQGLLADPVAAPDLVIYLEARPEVLLRRLRKRNRDFERRITPARPAPTPARSPSRRSQSTTAGRSAVRRAAASTTTGGSSSTRRRRRRTSQDKSAISRAKISSMKSLGFTAAVILPWS